MATQVEIDELRLMVGDPKKNANGDVIEPFFSDTYLGTWVDKPEDLEYAASKLWGIKAANVADWYTTNIDGAFLSRGEAFDHAMKMQAKYWGDSESASTITSVIVYGPNQITDEDAEFVS